MNSNESIENTALSNLGIDKIVVGTGDEGTNIDANQGGSISPETKDKSADPTDSANSPADDAANTGDVGEGNESNKGDDEEVKGEGTVGEVEINADGDVVDADGKILLKKGEFETDEEGNLVVTPEIAEKLGFESGEGEGADDVSAIIESAVEAIKADLGVTLLDATGKPLEFADDEKGLAALAQATAQEMFNANVQSFFNENPEMFKLFNHLQAGGSQEDYLKGNHFQDYKNMPDPTTDAQKEALIKESFVVANGMNTEMAQKMVNLLKDAGELDENVTTAKEALADYQTTAEAKVQEQLELKQAAEQKALVEYWTDVKSVVDKGDLGTTIIPKSEREAFFDYMSKPVQNGKSQSMLDQSEADTTNQVLVEYLRFKKFNLGDFVKKTLANKEAKSFTKRRTTMKLKMKKSNADNGVTPGTIGSFPSPMQLERN